MSHQIRRIPFRRAATAAAAVHAELPEGDRLLPAVVCEGARLQGVRGRLDDRRDRHELVMHLHRRGHRRRRHQLSRITVVERHSPASAWPRCRFTRAGVGAICV